MIANFYAKLDITAVFRKAKALVANALHRSTRLNRLVIFEKYKGAEIRINAIRFGHHAWQCKIRIRHARKNGLRSVTAMSHATQNGVSKDIALSSAFIEAMTLCDATLDKSISIRDLDVGRTGSSASKQA